MADEPDNLVPRMLREICAKQDEHSERFERVEQQLEHLKKDFAKFGRLVTYSLGQSTATQFRQTEQESRIDELFEKLEELLKPKEPA
jgi:ABC-type Fe3+-citrate transport system substrate-binding protein